MGITNYQHLIDEEVDANATLPSPETIPVDSKGKAGGKNTDTVTDAIMDTLPYSILNHPSSWKLCETLFMHSRLLIGLILVHVDIILVGSV